MFRTIDTIAVNRAIMPGITFIVIFAALGMAQEAASQEDWISRVEGTVLTSRDQVPVSGAQVALQISETSVVTDRSGRFTFSHVPLSENPMPVTITVNADGYGEWRIEDVLLLRSLLYYP